LPEPAGNPKDPVEPGSCGCRLAGNSSHNAFVWAIGALCLAGLARRRRTVPCR
jgi:hypothetical protein